MVRKFMGLKRHHIIVNGRKIGTEDWLAWQIRSMSRASTEIRSRGLEIAHLVKVERVSWAGHVCRFGLADKPVHLSKYVVSWRCRYWWNSQQLFNDMNWEPIKHRYPFKPRRWEDSLPDDWQIKMCNQGPNGVLV